MTGDIKSHSIEEEYGEMEFSTRTDTLTYTRTQTQPHTPTQTHAPTHTHSHRHTHMVTVLVFACGYGGSVCDHVRVQTLIHLIRGREGGREEEWRGGREDKIKRRRRVGRKEGFKRKSW